MSSRRTFLAVLAVALIGACAVLFVRTLSPEDDTERLPRFSSYFMQPEFVNDAFSAVGSVSYRRDVTMVLVNHHLIASNFIARIMKVIATDEPCTVVIISPDHFAAGAAPVTSVVAQWPTPFGILEPARDAIATLASEGGVNLQKEPFAREHGITNITMFIKKAMPAARLVPVIVRDDAKPSRMDALARAIGALPGRVVIIGSFDFTHDATDIVARANDARSLQLLQRGEPDDAERIIVDSKPGIRLMMELARIRHLVFTVTDMSNSAQVLHEPSRTDVTSYITGTWAPADAGVY